MNANDYIGVFDSGVGGVSVLGHLVRLMPQERYLFFGDSANAPYGTKSRPEVERLTLDAADRLLGRGIKALVVACNTATSAAIETLRAQHPELIIVGIEPALKLAAQQFPGGTLAVMATPMTLGEEKFARLMARFQSQCTICQIPAPGLVELVEAGQGNSPQAEALVAKLFAPCPRFDAVVLGCTHYPFAAGAISRVVGSDVPLLDGGEGTARETRRRLAQAGLQRSGQGEIIFESSGNTGDMERLARQLLGEMGGR